MPQRAGTSWRIFSEAAKARRGRGPSSIMPTGQGWQHPRHSRGLGMDLGWPSSKACPVRRCLMHHGKGLRYYLHALFHTGVRGCCDLDCMEFYFRRCADGLQAVFDPVRAQKRGRLKQVVVAGVESTRSWRDVDIGPGFAILGVNAGAS